MSVSELNNQNKDATEDIEEYLAELIDQKQYSKALTIAENELCNNEVKNYWYPLIKFFLDNNIENLSSLIDKAKNGDDLAEYLLARAFEEKKEYEKSIYWFKKYLDGNPDDEIALFDLAYLYDEIQNVDEAIYWYEKSVAAGSYEAKFNLAYLLYSLDLQMDRAFKYFDELRESGDIDSLFYLASILIKTGNNSADFANAKKYLEEFVKFGDSDYLLHEGYYLLSTFYMDYDKERFKTKNLFKAKEFLELSLEYGRKNGEDVNHDCAPALSTVNHLLNIDKSFNNKMGVFAEEISKKNVSIKELFAEVDIVLKEKFNDFYEVLSPYSRTCLTTSLLAYISLANVGEENYEKLDFSSVISPMTKVCEIELGRIFENGLIKFLKEKEVPPTEFDPSIQKFVFEKKNSVPPLLSADITEINDQTANLEEYNYFKQKKYERESTIHYISNDKFGFSLGGVQNYLNIRQLIKPIGGASYTDKNGKEILVTEKSIEMNEHILDYFDIIFKDEVFKGNNRRELIKKYLYRFSQKVKNIAFELRNPSSHTQVMPYWKAVYCGNILFMKDNFIVDFLSKIKPEYLAQEEE